jgi:hypothetical protein
MSRRYIYALSLLAAVMSGCSPPPGKRAPDDAGSVRVHCNKSSLRWDACYEMAANVCGEKGYQIVSDDDNTMPTATTNVNEVPVIGGSLVIRCNP